MTANGVMVIGIEEHSLMINKFSPNTIEKIGYYVYIFSDPDTHQPFYVGQGQGNRVFSHLKEENNSSKVKMIKCSKQPVRTLKR